MKLPLLIVFAAASLFSTSLVLVMTTDVCRSLGVFENLTFFGLLKITAFPKAFGPVYLFSILYTEVEGKRACTSEIVLSIKLLSGGDF